MTDNEFILFDRCEKIKSVIKKYGEENFYISFSGGKDSTILSELVDYAIPNNKIPRVFVNTGIEYNLIIEFVKKKQKQDSRFIIIVPSLPIKTTLEKYGYPFKSKDHADKVKIYQRNGYTKTAERYLNPPAERIGYKCPKVLEYQFTEDFRNNFKTKISKSCCDKMKKAPLHEWQRINNKPYGIVGIMKAEGGARLNSNCFAFKSDKKTLKNFQPLVPVTKEWEEWFIETAEIEICDIYKYPYNFERTGCKGCPFNPNLQKDLDTLEKYFPAERKQCEYIWKPIYDEYRRIGYRLKK